LGFATARGFETSTPRIHMRKSGEATFDARQAFPGLLNDVIVSHVLREEHLPDPADLAVLRAVSRGMRDAVDATGRDIKELDEISAAEYGYLSTLRCMQRRGLLAREERLCRAAARIGDLEELKSLRANGCPWDEETCAKAAMGGHLGVLKWARANGCEWDEETCSYAAMGGHLEMLQWARANGCEWDEATCSCAARGGHLALLQWARAKGCPWDEFTCARAAYGGHLNVLKWAHSNGCPWNESTCVYAAQRGHLEVLQFAHANGCPWKKESCGTMAETFGHIETAAWIRRLATWIREN